MKISNEIEVRRCHHVIVIAVFVIVIIPLLLLIIIIVSIIIIIVVVVITVIRIIKLSDINILINHPFGWLASKVSGLEKQLSMFEFHRTVLRRIFHKSGRVCLSWVHLDKGVFNIDVLLHHLRSNQVGFVSKMRG